MPEVLNIGWLIEGIEFKKGKSPPEFLSKLKTLIEISIHTSPLQLVLGRMRGRSRCPLCGISSHEIKMDWERRNIKMGLSHAELWVPSNCRNEMYYSSSTYVAHYIMHHDYLPPDEYINSVMSVDESAKINAEKIAMYLERKAFSRSRQERKISDNEYNQYLKYLDIMEKLIDE